MEFFSSNKYTKSALVVAISAGITAPVVLANDFIIRVPLKEQLSTWNDATSLFEPWANTGGHYGCNGWSPKQDAVDFGSGFLQSRSCKENQSRLVTERELDKFSNTFRITGTRTESRVVNEIESQSKVGTRRNWVVFTPDYTNWQDTDIKTEHAAWAPEAVAQLSDFSQSRDYKMGQSRNRQNRDKDAVTGDIRDNGNVIVENRKETRNESRSVDVAAAAWINTGGHFGCEVWSPAPSTIDFGTAFTQSRDCSQNQNRAWSYKAGGSSIHSRVEPRTITEMETKSETGIKQNWVAHSSTFTSWTNSGGRTGYSGWTAAAASQTSSFTQTRSYSQAQTRNEQKRQRDTITGQIRNAGSAIARLQSIGGSESRTVAVTVGGWGYSGGNYSCGAWSPSTGTVNYGSAFTQSRSCSRNQSRTWLYKVGSSTIHSRAQARVVGTSESRTATGTKTVVVAASSSWTPWSTYSTTYGGYSPVASKQTSNFTQSRSRTYAQRRYEQKRQYVNGVLQNVGSAIAYTRSIAGSAQSRAVSVSSSGYVNYGGVYSCGSWSPDTSTVNSGQNYTQTRSCRQGIRNTYSFSIGGSHYYSSSKSVSQSRSATGTKATKKWVYSEVVIPVECYRVSTPSGWTASNSSTIDSLKDKSCNTSTKYHAKSSAGPTSCLIHQLTCQ